MCTHSYLYNFALPLPTTMHIQILSTRMQGFKSNRLAFIDSRDKYYMGCNYQLLNIRRGWSGTAIMINKITWGMDEQLTDSQSDQVGPGQTGLTGHPLQPSRTVRLHCEWARACAAQSARTVHQEWELHEVRPCDRRLCSLRGPAGKSCTCSKPRH